MSTTQSPSTKPYLIRAIHEWCVDNGFTPYVVVQVDGRTRVPPQHVRDGQIVLNIAPYATNRLMISNDDISCQARFGGVAQDLYIPVSQVLAVYARETGQGVAFQPGVLAGSAMEMGGVIEGVAGDAQQTAVSVIAEDGVTADGNDEDPPPAAPARGGHLRRIK
ncbi:MAG: ClpXP protease specificity-enhancing factor [Candidatus Dactylopiibacterium carminicum]|uniref:ClpXP protease specificity-enhancing factor n=1 Tax=Candidatus Dactylopiibacterium carminicum TaxID=857335 RepID=A0A272ENX6_9RHOO|nr:ClpXP protease specificity-enhancing factor [Candidatus Dactylopiibacterium carminicum]KAF7598110.1 stringent starvation protein B [Candidatus Dactylopiibacterium carminicum]PAS91736.1 MAG: ClpXP protease specificity-enhancing factor [Candidatus Dactylopiibacterium carminicum]PAS93876.1 MAG: ClpXP protease specificity-enhancing factor [Candidatus Dactylopiibacterium carminicum]PAS96628.1 MAG: ClpXP protease specificity-enhancing factor [Candidatus Dactylopiibacterium carminicum]